MGADLRAERKSPQTIKAYTTGVQQYLDWSASERTARGARRRQLAGFTDQSSTRSSRHCPIPAAGGATVLRWLVEEGELDADPLLGVKPPKLDTKVVEPLTDDADQGDVQGLRRATGPARTAATRQ